MKKLLLLLLLFVMMVPAARAQVNINQVAVNEKRNMEGNPNIISEEDLISEFSSITPISKLMETAAETINVAAINVVDNENMTTITQTGTNIIGAINVNGFNDNAITMKQDGSNLLSLITVEGPANTLDMVQHGSNLGNLVQVEGSGINVNLTHDPSGFRYLQQGAATPIVITSTSSYVPVIIRNN